MPTILALVGFLLLLSPVSQIALAAPSAVHLARDGRALLVVTTSPQASDGVIASARDLATYLGRMSGSDFKVQEGDGSQGIVVGQPKDFAKLPFAIEFDNGPFAREDYLLRSHGDSLYLLGPSDLAVSHAVWDLLHRLGYRQFFPGDTWEVVPTLRQIQVALDERQSPSFHSRRIWYNWGLWGYNDEPYRQWCQRNRAVKGFDLNSGHSYESIIAANRAEFDKHPEFYALVQGERKLRPDVKFCVANDDLRKLVVTHAVRAFQANPQLDSISMDPSDGGNWCECEACEKFGSVSDRVVRLANDVAVGVNGLGLGPKYVGMYAYNKHSAPPTIKVHPKVIPSATTAFIGGGFTFDQVVRGWQEQGATMGVYDYLSVVDWDWNLPRGGRASHPAQLAKFLPDIHTKGVRFYDAESGDCWGPCGLGYYFASRILWDVHQADELEAIVEDFLDKAFADAKEPMREFYRLINQDSQRRPPSDLLGRMYRQLSAARQATTNTKVRERIDQLTLYTRHAELYYAFANVSGSKEDVARHAYRMRKTMMVHSYGLWCRLISQQAALAPNHPLKSEEPFSQPDLDRILDEGIKRHQPVDPGFAGKDYSRKLV